MPITLGRASTYRLPEHRNAVDFGTERLRRVTLCRERVRSLVNRRVNWSAEFDLHRSVDARDVWTDGQLVPQATRPEQQLAFRQVTDWLPESELLRQARDLYLVCRAKDA